MDTAAPAHRTAGWTCFVAFVAVFMVTIDTLVVTTALPSIRSALGASLADLQWMVNAYTLTIAVFLLTGAALGDRFGRRRVFTVAMAVFTVASAAAAMAGSSGGLIAARAAQGLGAAVIMPLTLTLIASAVPPRRQAHAFGLWGAMVGLGVALGPVIGGATAQHWSWQWIFWINVPIGVLVLPAMVFVRESRGGAGRLDPVGVLLVTIGLFGVVLGLVRGNTDGWSSGRVLASLGVGGVFVLAFLGWEAGARHPMVPLTLFRSRGFSLTMVGTVVMPFGVFGAVFLGTQYLQTLLGYSPLAAGVATLPWTAMPMIAAPVAGLLTDRVGGKTLVVAGLALQAVGIAWIGLIAAPDLPYGELVVPFAIAGLGLGTYLTPIARLAIGFAPPDLAGVASGVTNAIRQLGTVLGVSVGGTILGSYDGFSSPAAFIDGLRVSHLVAAAALAAGAVACIAIPRLPSPGRRPAGAEGHALAASPAPGASRP